MIDRRSSSLDAHGRTTTTYPMTGAFPARVTVTAVNGVVQYSTVVSFGSLGLGG